MRRSQRKSGSLFRALNQDFFGSLSSETLPVTPVAYNLVAATLLVVGISQADEVTCGYK